MRDGHKAGPNYQSVMDGIGALRDLAYNESNNRKLLGQLDREVAYFREKNFGSTDQRSRHARALALTLSKIFKRKINIEKFYQSLMKMANSLPPERGTESALRMRVIRYVNERITDPGRDWSPVTAVQFNKIRNHIVTVCRRHGGVGPLGMRKPPKSKKPDVRDYDPADDAVAYYILDDQLNEEQYIYIDVLDPNGLSLFWLSDIADFLSDYPYWGVGISNIRKGYMIAFNNFLLVSGKIFSECNHVDEVLKVARSGIKPLDIPK